MCAAKRRLWCLLFAAMAAPACSSDAGSSGPGDTDAPDTADEAPIAFDDAAAYDLVDPFIATGGLDYNAGQAHPGALAPFGMLRAAPVTMNQRGAPFFLHYVGYYYPDEWLVGMSHNSLYTVGLGDLNSGLVAAVPSFTPESIRINGRSANRTPGYRFKMNKQRERAQPGYYAVEAADGSLDWEVTATTRAALHRITFTAGGQGTLLFDLGHTNVSGESLDAEVTIGEDGEVSGWMYHKGVFTGRFGGYRLYFVARADRPIVASGIWFPRVFEGSELVGGAQPGVKTGRRKDVGAYLTVALDDTKQARLRYAISYVSIEKARANLAAEIPDFDFDAVRAKQRKVWTDEVTKVRVWGDDEVRKRKFYSAVYRAFVMPTNMTDHDGSYPAFGDDPDGLRETLKATDHVFYSDLSLWDTYRTTHPLYNLLQPKVQRDVVQTLLEMQKQTKSMPRWPCLMGESGAMIGAAGELVVSDAYVKGIRDFDVETAFEILRKLGDGEIPEAVSEGRGNGLVEYYIPKGYFPNESGSSASSRVLEANAADYGFAKFAEKLGRTDIAERYRRRAKSYGTIFDRETEFTRGISADGTFLPLGDELTQWKDWFSEGNTWHYTFMVPFDPQGLIALFKSRESFEAKLTQYFVRTEENDPVRAASDILRRLPEPYYWHGNEPPISGAFLFNAIGRPDLTARWVQWIINNRYGDGPDGLPGNDDGGTLSAWLVFAASGFFPVPGADGYHIVAPSFPKLQWKIGDGWFTIETTGFESGRVNYITAAQLNGRPLTTAWLPHAEIKAGGVLRFELAGAPGDWGRTPVDPFSN